MIEVTSKKGDRTNDLVKVLVFDDTDEATISLWGSMALSTTTWKAAHTVLLLTRPGCNVNNKIWLSIKATTMVDIDPDISDALWLRAYALRMTKRSHVNPPFVENGKRTSFVHFVALAKHRA